MLRSVIGVHHWDLAYQMLQCGVTPDTLLLGYCYNETVYEYVCRQIYSRVVEDSISEDSDYSKDSDYIDNSDSDYIDNCPPPPSNDNRPPAQRDDMDSDFGDRPELEYMDRGHDYDSGVEYDSGDDYTE